MTHEGLVLLIDEVLHQIVADDHKTFIDTDTTWKKRWKSLRGRGYFEEPLKHIYQSNNIGDISRKL
jgi:hypothetical protein